MTRELLGLPVLAGQRAQADQPIQWVQKELPPQLVQTTVISSTPPVQWVQKELPAPTTIRDPKDLQEQRDLKAQQELRVRREILELLASPELPSFKDLITQLGRRGISARQAQDVVRAIRAQLDPKVLRG